VGKLRCGRLGQLLKRRIVHHVVAALITTSFVVCSAVGAEPSSAAGIGSFTFGPTSGTDTTMLTLDTSGPCLDGTTFQVLVTGPGFPVGGFPVSAAVAVSSLVGNPAGGYTVPLSDSMKNFADAQTPPATLSGTYSFSGQCMDASGGTTFDTFGGSIDFTQNSAASPSYVAKVEVVFGYFTATALAAAPGGPVNAGTPVTFTAHVSSSPTGGALGTVQLLDGTDPIGNPTAVDASGNAIISTSFTAGGYHSVTAAFTGGFAFVTSSTSLPLVMTVNAAPADPTATSLAISPSSVTAAGMVTLTAAVVDVPHPSSQPLGTVQFLDSGTAVGAVVPVTSAGTATLSRQFGEGGHAFTASFVPTDPLLFDPSSSTSEAYRVAPAAGVPQTIETTVDPGSLTMSIADTGTVVLPAPVLNVTATFLTTTGRLQAVTVTDTRAGNPGWVLSGQVTDFTSTTGNSIAAVNLGWTPDVVDESPGQVVVLGGPVSPAAPPLVLDPPGGAFGLHVSRTLASTAAGSGTGTAQLGADLALNVPTSVQAGVYEATLTLTVI
jgi:hypothetical protein